MINGRSAGPVRENFMPSSNSSLARLAFLSGLAALPLGATTTTIHHVHHHAAHVKAQAQPSAAHVATHSAAATAHHGATLHHASLTYTSHHSYERFTGNSF